MSWRVGAPNIRHKLPFKAYVGIKSNGKKGVIEIDQVIAYQVEKDMFADTEDLNEYSKKISTIVDTLITKKIGSKDFDGFTINILSEREEKTGVNVSYTALIVLASFIQTHLLDPRVLNEMKYASHDQLYRRKNDGEMKFFRSIQNEIIKTFAQVNHGIVTGVTSYSGFVYSEFPLVYITESRNGTIDEKFGELKPLHVSSNVEVLDDLIREGYRLNELTDISGTFPLDVACIYPGSSRGFLSAVQHVKQSVRPRFNELRNKTVSLFNNFVEYHKENSQRLPSFLTDAADEAYMHRYLEGQVYTRVNLLDALIHLYQNKMSHNAQINFFDAINALQNINTPFEEHPSKNLQFIMRKIRKVAQEKGIEVGILSLHWGKNDGNIFVYSAPDKFREEIKSIVQELQSDYNPNITLDFASWRDGWGIEGLTIEQDLKSGKISPIIPPDARRVIMWDGKNHSEKIVSPETIEHENFDIVFDAVNKEIIIAGEKFSSKELPTKKASVELFSFLAQHVGEMLQNNELPESSYSGYRNDLQGKVIGPVEKLVREKINKSLGVSITGGLSNFNIQFKPKDITWACVMRLN